MQPVSPRYFAAFLGAISSIAAAASTVIVVSKIEVQRADFLAVMAGLLAVGLAITSAAYMQQILKKQQLRRALPRVFIIYAKDDLPKAREIATLLRRHGLEPWLDVEQIEAGQVWKDTLNSALDESAMAIVLSSQNLAKSSIATEELNRAISRMQSNDKTTSPIIPVKVDGSEVPKSISHIQYVDMSVEGASDFLVKSVEGAMRRIVESHPDSHQSH
jgi:hypothetical protein